MKKARIVVDGLALAKAAEKKRVGKLPKHQPKEQGKN